MESKQQNKQTKQKQTQRYRAQIDDCQRGGGLGNWVKKVKGLRTTNWQPQNSHGDVKYTLGNIVNNITITMYCARWVLKILGGLFGSLRSAMTFGKNKHL